MCYLTKHKNKISQVALYITVIYYIIYPVYNTTKSTLFKVFDQFHTGSKLLATKQTQNKYQIYKIKRE